MSHASTHMHARHPEHLGMVAVKSSWNNKRRSRKGELELNWTIPVSRWKMLWRLSGWHALGGRLHTGDNPHSPAGGQVETQMAAFVKAADTLPTERLAYRLPMKTDQLGCKHIPIICLFMQTSITSCVFMQRLLILTLDICLSAHLQSCTVRG